MIAFIWSLSVFGTLASVAAWAAEQSRWLLGRSRRLPWLLAIAATVAWPWARSFFGEALASSPVAGVTGMPPMVIAAQAATAVSNAHPKLADGLAFLWGVASLCLLLRLAQAARAATSAVITGEHSVVEGHSVVLSDAFGPAVVGWVRPRVLWPRWLSEIDPSLRTVILRHEHEHCRARDPLWLFAAECAVVLMPWHPAIWWMRFRLRAAVELDCDTRVLADAADAPRYGKLLMLLAQRQPSLRLASMLAEPRSLLAWRIFTMTTLRPRYSRLRAMMFAAASFAAVVTACSSALTHAGGTAPAAPSVTKVYFEFEVEEPVQTAPGSAAPIYPPEQKAAGLEGKVLAHFVVGTDGLVEPGTFKALRGTLLDATGRKISFTKGASDTDLTPFEVAVRDALPNLRFVPAKVKGVTVRQVVQQPFVFALAKK